MDHILFIHPSDDGHGLPEDDFAHTFLWAEG